MHIDVKNRSLCEAILQASEYFIAYDRINKLMQYVYTANLKDKDRDALATLSSDEDRFHKLLSPVCNTIPAEAKEDAWIINTMYNSPQVYDSLGFEHDPFIAMVNTNGKVTHGEVEITSEDVPRYSLYETGILLKDPFIPYKTVYEQCILNADTRMVSMRKGDNWIASTSPCEIITQQNFRKNAKGKVLICGLGLGYLPYVLSQLRPDITSITVIEDDLDIIHAFDQIIRPQLEYTNKIGICYADPITFLSAAKEEDYDSCFIKSQVNVSKYIEYLKACKHLKKTYIEYWIEDATIRAIQEELIAYMVLKVIKGNQDVVKEEGSITIEHKDFFDAVFKGVNISSKKDLYDFLNIASLKQTLHKCKL